MAASDWVNFCLGCGWARKTVLQAALVFEGALACRTCGVDLMGAGRVHFRPVVETSTEFPLHTVLLFAAMAVGMGGVPLCLAWLWARLFSPQKPGPDKTSNYECGLASEGDPGGQQNVQYYLYAIVFLVFDVESVFLIPFAAAFTGLSLGAVLAMAVFLLLLAEGLVWAWLKGILTWH